MKINDIDNFISDQMNRDMPAPGIHLVEAARKKVMARRKTVAERGDIFAMLAAFLNFRIRLYHAVLLVILVSGIIWYFTRTRQNTTSPPYASQYVSNIAAVRNSTVLSSINTFILRK
jgi:hypothetical protein